MDRQSVEDSGARLSSVEQSNPTTDNLYCSMLELSRRNSGDQTAHISNTHEFMVLDKKWLSETQFNQIHNLCWNLPGSTTSQIIITVITLKYKSLSTAVNCFFVYNTIPWMLLTILGFLSNYYLVEDETKFDMIIRMTLMGSIAAGAGIMVRCVFKYFIIDTKSYPKVMLSLISGVIFFFYRSQNSIIFCLAMSAIVSLYLQAQNQGPRKKMSQKSSNMFKSLKFNTLLGKPSLLILVFLFLGLWTYFSIFSGNQFEYVFYFYWIGCFIIGPVEIVFAYFISIMLSFPGINYTQMWIGVAFGFLVPGSHLNIGIYFGFLIDGLRGAVLAAFFLYIPCFLFLLGMLPQWKYYREMGGIKRIYEGLQCSTTGMTLAVVIMIMEKCMSLDAGCAVCIFLICAVLNCFLNRYAFMTILVGAGLGYGRYLAVECYRYGVYCPFPFNF